jgi:type III restriction enzyme
MNLILKVRGFQTEPERPKEVAAQRWVRAVNHHGGFGVWGLAVCRDPHKLESVLIYRSFFERPVAKGTRDS